MPVATYRQLQHNATAMGGAVPFGSNGVGELSEGSIGTAVKELQSKLNVLQYGPVPVDGKFGESTVAALKNFQQVEQLPATGKLDAVTEARLNQRILNLQAAGMGGVSADSAAQAQAQQQQMQQQQMQPVRPLWQTGLMILGGIALVGGILYVLSDKSDSAGYKRALAPGREPRDIPGRYDAKGARVAGAHNARAARSAREKCPRTPDENAFSEGELLAPMEV